MANWEVELMVGVITDTVELMMTSCTSSTIIMQGPLATFKEKIREKSLILIICSYYV